MKHLNQSWSAASVAINNGSGILFRTVNWIASFLKPSGVHPKYYRSIKNRYSSSSSSTARVITGLCPNFDWEA
jgi:hypothetical protein